MAERKFTALLIAMLAVFAACTGGTERTPEDEAIEAPDTGDPAAGTRPSGEPQLLSLEGRIQEGVECPLLETPDGRTYALSIRGGDFTPGDYVRLDGEIADASFCQQGEGTLIVEQIAHADPPARDRDPARAGGVRLTADYLAGSWVAKGLEADCDTPDFRIVASPAAVVLKGDIGRHDDTVRVVLDQYPRLDFDEPLDDLPIESRGPDGLAILRPATDAAYDPVRIGSARIVGDGVVFVKCAA